MMLELGIYTVPLEFVPSGSSSGEIFSLVMLNPSNLFRPSIPSQLAAFIPEIKRKEKRKKPTLNPNSLIIHDPNLLQST